MSSTNRFFTAATLLLFLLPCTCVLAQNWESLSPGSGGQLQDVYFDPDDEGTIWLSSDVDGSYRSTDYGQSWNFIGRDLVHGMSFIIRKSNNANGRIYQGGLYGAHYSDDGGDSWTFIDETAEDAIATIAISNDDQTIVLAPSWNAKDPQKQQQALIDPVQPLTGPRFIYVSRDGGDTWSTRTYEPTDGYRHVFGAHIDDNDVIYLAAASGLYRSTNANYTNWDRTPNPAGAFSTDGNSANGGIQTDSTFSSPGKPDWNSFRKSGGTLGLAFTPNEDRLFVCYQMSAGTWEVFSTRTSQLGNNSDPWENVSAAGGASLPTDIPWVGFVTDPRNSNTDVKFLVGSTFLGNNTQRVGTYEASIILNGSGAITGKSWEQILFNKSNDQSTNGPWTFEEGWETVPLISRTFDYTPLSWTASGRRIIAGGGNVFFLSDNESQAGWPNNANSWLPIYTKRDNDNSYGSTTTWETRGYANTVTYDVAAYGNYVIQGNADQGILESWDGGRSWTKELAGFNNSNSQAVAVTNTQPPIVLADGRANSYGIPKGYLSNFQARLLTDLNQQEEKSDWRTIGGKANGKVVQGLPNRFVQCLELDRRHPSRVYAGLQKTYGIGGLYATEEIEAVYAGTGDWREIGSPAMRTVFRFNDVFVDPNDSDILWVGNANGKIYKGVRTAPYTWSWTESSYKMADLYVWDNNGTTVVAFSGTPDNNPNQVYLLNDPTAAGVGAYTAVGLTPQQSLNIRPEAWNVPVGGVDIEGMAGYGNKIIVTTVAARYKKGLGVFRGTISGSGTGVAVNWQDFTTDGSGFDFFYPRDGTADAKIIRQTNGDLFYAIPTFGAGVWWRKVGTDGGPPNFSVSTSGLRFAPASGETQSAQITSSVSWQVQGSLPAWVTASSTSGSGNRTINFTTAQNNNTGKPRSADVSILAAGRLTRITLTQASTPVRIEYVAGGITINGNQEAAWNAAPVYNISSTVKGVPAAGTDQFQLAFDDDNLYLLGRVGDATVRPYDGLQVGIDVTNDKNTVVTSSTHFVFTVTRDGTTTFAAESATAGVQTGLTRSGNTDTYELSVSWSDLGITPVAGSSLGLEVRSLDDQSATDSLEQISQFYGFEDMVSRGPIGWGDAELSGGNPPAGCGVPSALAAGSVTTDGASLSWSAGSNATGYEVGYRTAGSGSYTTLTVSGTSRTLSGLAAGTGYEWRVRTDCGGTNSAWVDGPTFTTATAQGGGGDGYYEPFSRAGCNPSDGPVAGFACYAETTITYTGIGTVGQSASNTEPGTSGGYHVFLQDSGANFRAAGIDTRGGSDLSFSFWVRKNSRNDDGSSLLVELLNGNSVVATVPVSLPTTIESNDTWYQVTAPASVTIPAIADLGYRFTRTNNTKYRIDDIRVDGDFSGPPTTTAGTVFREEHELAGCGTNSSQISAHGCYSFATGTHTGDGEVSTGTSSDYPGASGDRNVFLRGNNEFYTIGNIDAGGFSQLELTFATRKNSRNDDGASLGLEVSTNGGTSWTTLPGITLPTTTESNATWYVRTVDVPVAASGTMAVRFTSTTGTRYRLDDVELTGQTAARAAGPETMMDLPDPRPAASALRLYPNPVTDELILELDTPGWATQLSVFDLNGRLLLTGKPGADAGARLPLNVRPLPAGLYLLRVDGVEGSQVHKFSKQ